MSVSMSGNTKIQHCFRYNLLWIEENERIKKKTKEKLAKKEEGQMKMKYKKNCRSRTHHQPTTLLIVFVLYKYTIHMPKDKRNT